MKELVSNVGMTDRIIRMALGVGLITLVFWGPQTPWGLVGLIPLVTGLAGWCPAYKLLGVNTCPAKK